MREIEKDYALNQEDFAKGYTLYAAQLRALQPDAALETLRSVLELPAVPRRIECFDISTIQGSETVASMVVCEDGRMKRNEYRKFRIRGTSMPKTQLPTPKKTAPKRALGVGNVDVGRGT